MESYLKVVIYIRLQIEEVSSVNGIMRSLNACPIPSMPRKQSSYEKKSSIHS
jgi:hypothetical protein